nr:uncharacterized protein LOC129283176 [Lytechinus pictus]
MKLLEFVIKILHTTLNTCILPNCSSQELVPLFSGGIPLLTEMAKRTAFSKGATKEALLCSLLEAVFGESLAHGNACGSRPAVNKGEGEESKPLDKGKLDQIKECVLRRFRTPGGHSCFSAQEFNKKINQKCATVQEALTCQSLE